MSGNKERPSNEIDETIAELKIALEKWKHRMVLESEQYRIRRREELEAYIKEASDEIERK